MIKKRLKAGLKERGGPPPGYAWSVSYLSVAADEARGFLTDAEYGHVVDQLKTLASEEDPTRPQMVLVEKVEDVYELKIKGGPLRKKNVRVFFFVASGRRIVLLGCKKKENDGSMPPATKKLMNVRKRKCEAGVYGEIE